ncbi:ISPsy24, transposase orfA [Pseudomonas syringae pv. coriandricola]|uniref:ISPsy24, transposase orfA n=1 Tax=Pseudomonas syringae pv. coriandricola TaxID=264453 RepID=A0A3M4UG89_9PSED|nr:ISPsy24, transposase orfA [Pseudomonas syringae pv. coriandricola]RMU08281.1 ISPsy24, transposase orfA [Pseudomonas syringae pv. coriandricola]
MTKQRRTFSAEFKREAAGLVLDQGYSHIEASRSLGVVESALRRWVNQLQQERNGVTPQSKALTPEQQKIQELEARNADAWREENPSRLRLGLCHQPVLRSGGGRLRLQPEPRG